MIENTETENKLIVDEDTLLQIVKDTSPAVVPMLIEHYIAEAEQHVAAMLKAAEENDIQTLLHESHTLGSSALALGNTALSQLSRQIEAGCRGQDTEQAIQLTLQLEALAYLSFQQLNIRKEHGFESFM